MVVLAWIGQILLFFIAWKALHWAVVGAKPWLGPSPLIREVVVNVVMAVLLLIILHSVGSVWWAMLFIGAIIGVITGQMALRSS
ncbi:hypothetical protein [Alicyclobacillus macrosporangiidus]|jgi:hypothetical protein|uniref:Uncharacterized protein n=1 Tax=Alicyclobacillus macrosporangiidus TaxID=392015 RepID=A0A1I7LDX1_9BACL|nr:hypothetical protein [Alicyclobacillus macrosporangiidus]SFV07890.1 hypothetical protein SAMN05421543_1405 [Alicyclobacillus macrosporangiidus]